jgi:hypothetical protein
VRSVQEVQHATMVHHLQQQVMLISFNLLAR